MESASQRSIASRAAVHSNYVFGASAAEMQKANVFSTMLGSMLPVASIAALSRPSATYPMKPSPNAGQPRRRLVIVGGRLELIGDRIALADLAGKPFKAAILPQNLVEVVLRQTKKSRTGVIVMVRLPIPKLPIISRALWACGVKFATLLLARMPTELLGGKPQLVKFGRLVGCFNLKTRAAYVTYERDLAVLLIDAHGALVGLRDAGCPAAPVERAAKIGAQTGSAKTTHLTWFPS